VGSNEVSVTEEERLARLRNAGSAVAAAGERTAAVLGVLDATFARLPGPLDVPKDPRARLAIAQEVTVARAELVAANGALSALNAKHRELVEPLGTDPDVKAVLAIRHELEAVEGERRKQRDRVAVLEATNRDLDGALAQFRAPPG
jgi:hypothetical protein